LIATLIATALSTWFYYLGLARMLWPAHPRMAAFLITLAATLEVQIFWPSAPPQPDPPSSNQRRAATDL